MGDGQATATKYDGLNKSTSLCKASVVFVGGVDVVEVDPISRKLFVFLQKASEMPNPKAPYPARLREQMIELVHAVKQPSELAKDFGCHVSSILSAPHQTL